MVGTAIVRKILFPQMIGVECPFPGLGFFHLTFLTVSHSSGASLSARALSRGLHQVGCHRQENQGDRFSDAHGFLLGGQKERLIAWDFRANDTTDCGVSQI